MWNTNDKRRERIQDLLNEGLPASEIDAKIAEEFDCSRDAAFHARKRFISGASKTKVENAGDTKDTVNLNHKDRTYEFTFFGQQKGYSFSVGFDEIREIVFWYVREGCNMTQKEVCAKVYLEFNRKITHDFMRRMLAVMDIQKSSPPVARHQYEEGTLDELVNDWNGRDEARLEAKYRVSRRREVERLLQIRTNQLLGLQDLIDDALEASVLTPVPEPEFIEEIELSSTDPASIVICFSDWHYGMATVNRVNQFDMYVCKRRLDIWLHRFEQYWSRNAHRIGAVSVAFLGDMLDGVHNMKADHHLRRDVHGVDQIVGCSDLMAMMVTQIWRIVGDRLKHVRTVSGNHGRDSFSNKDDPQRVPETIAYHLAAAKGAVRDEMWGISHDSPVNEFMFGNHYVILTHGDRMPRKPRDLAWPRISEGHKVVILSGHLHSIQCDGMYDSDVTAIRNASVCGTDVYALDHLGHHSVPAQVIVELTQHGVVPIPIFMES